MCLDDKGVQDLIPELSRQVVTYGRHADADYRLDNYRSAGCAARRADLPRSAAPLALTVNIWCTMPRMQPVLRMRRTRCSEGAIVKGWLNLAASNVSEFG